MKNAILFLAISFLVLITGLSSSAQITVDLTAERWTPLLPNTPGQTRQIHVSGGGNGWGMDFRVQVEDDYSPSTFVGKNGPNIPNQDSAVDIQPGTIFASGTPPTFDSNNNNEQFAVRSIDVTPGPVSTRGLLA